jgi:hypothetical protein
MIKAILSRACRNMSSRGGEDAVLVMPRLVVMDCPESLTAGESVALRFWPFG